LVPHRHSGQLEALPLDALRARAGVPVAQRLQRHRKEAAMKQIKAYEIALARIQEAAVRAALALATKDTSR
jgi:hypothetical protein